MNPLLQNTQINVRHLSELCVLCG